MAALKKVRAWLKHMKNNSKNTIVQKTENVGSAVYSEKSAKSIKSVIFVEAGNIPRIMLVTAPTGSVITRVSPALQSPSPQIDAPKHVTFKDLPVELQLHVWKYTHPGPRIISLDYDGETGFLISRQPCPAILHVCRNSRATALTIFQWFKLAFAPTTLFCQNPPLHKQAQIYIDPGVDTFYYSRLDRYGSRLPALDLVIHCSFFPIKHLSFNSSCIIEKMSLSTSVGWAFFHCLAQLMTLEKITIVHDINQTYPLGSPHKALRFETAESIDQMYEEYGGLFRRLEKTPIEKLATQDHEKLSIGVMNDLDTALYELWTFLNTIERRSGIPGWKRPAIEVKLLVETGAY